MTAKKLTKGEIASAVLKLIGNVQPVGSTHIDDERYTNLEVMGEVFYRLFQEIDSIIYYNKNAIEFSRKNAVEKAEQIINNTISDYIYDLGYRKNGDEE